MEVEEPLDEITKALEDVDARLDTTNSLSMGAPSVGRDDIGRPYASPALRTGGKQDMARKLEAFINAVNAQRGNKLTTDYLIAKAQEIIDSIWTPVIE